MLITMSITVEEADEVEARRVAAALAAALAPAEAKPEPKAAKPAEAKPEPKAAKPAEAKPEPKAAKPAEAKPEPKAAKPAEAGDGPAEAGDGPTEDELLDQAALHAVALLQAGMTGSVREALTAVGARRVSQIQGSDSLQKFLSLLPEAPTSEGA